MARKPSSKSSKPSKAVQDLAADVACPIKEDLRFQKMTWIVERAGWLVMVVIVIAALAGLFGGSATREDVRDESGRLRVTYQHFQRHLDPTDLRISVDARGQSLFEVTMDQALASNMEIRTIMPAPLEMQAHNGGMLMKFAASPESEQPAQITITGVPTGFGKLNGRIGLLDESGAAQLDIFIYP
jgi:hypothetical protein